MKFEGYGIRNLLLVQLPSSTHKNSYDTLRDRFDIPYYCSKNIFVLWIGAKWAKKEPLTAMLRGSQRRRLKILR
jgi:hypothetical protein